MILCRFKPACSMFLLNPLPACPLPLIFGGLVFVLALTPGEISIVARRNSMPDIGNNVSFLFAGAPAPL